MQLTLNTATTKTTGAVPSKKNKTTATLFTDVQSGSLLVGNAHLSFENQQTYLGMTFAKQLTWKQHI